ncbi:bifunctional hydroxymethylpyrimidine kinase/phosphomethylpyrimidine kinase [Alphaproteobacteria bacterium]|nr:bifunctional hydroxymethylpyrimidine kinase/phosphomethylpyrimidine kinase [Alphaproteobacteria bacterium]
MKGRILSIAGTDPSGGAGIQADIKTISALNAYAMTVITALVAQNTCGVSSIVEIDSNFVEEQIDCVLNDIGVDAIKIGMLHSVDIINSVEKKIKTQSNLIPVVLDPVMFAKSGDSLLENNACNALIDLMIPISTIVTPNNPEAERIVGNKINNEAEAIEAGKKIISMGAKSVLMKGGHREGDLVKDILVYSNGLEIIESKRQESNNTHGTGCTLSSALATGLGQNLNILDATKKAHLFVQEAIRSALPLGKGNGPLNHCHLIEQITK